MSESQTHETLDPVPAYQKAEASAPFAGMTEEVGPEWPAFAALPESEAAGWGWHDARLIGVDRGEAAAGQRYEVGAIDLYADAATGDLGGSYLPIASFSAEGVATAFYHDLQAQLHAEGLAAHQVADFAEGQAFAMNAEPENWRRAERVEYAAYERQRSQEHFDPAWADDPPLEALDPLLRTALDLGGVLEPTDLEAQPVVEAATFQALQALGVQAEDLESNAPFYDAETGTAYWIGIFQADKADRERCVASILSLGRNPESGALEAQLAPCAPGDWDKALASAEYLIQVAQQGGMDEVFAIAEGMALASDQRELWETERGLGLEAETVQAIAAFTRDSWEVER